jgi:hypothetical protein
VERGYKTDDLLLADINFVGTSHNRDTQLEFYRRLLSRLKAAPGITSASISDNSAEGGTDTLQASAANVTIPITRMAIDEEYFRTLQVPLVAGRGFNKQDDVHSIPVGIINQKMALMFPPGESPIGRAVRTGDGTWVEVVGIARDIVYGNGSKSAKPALYRPLNQTQTALSGAAPVMLKFSGTAGSARRIIQETVSALDPSLLVYNVRTFDDQEQRIRLPYRIVLYAIGLPGAFALLLGVLGIYGTMAILVAQRRREVGIRIALGAHPSAAVRVVLNDGIKSVAVGIGLGIGAAVIIVLLLSRIIDADFFHPLAFLAMALLVVTTAGTACYFPARSASRGDPMIVLRED